MKKGFTLLEVILAITIFTLIVVIIGGTVRLGLKAWEKGEASADASMRLRGLSERLTQQIKSIYPYKMIYQEKPVRAFGGQYDAMWFVASTANYLYGGFKWYSYYVKDGTLMTNEGFMPDKQLGPKLFDGGQVLDRGLSKVRFRFLSPEGEWKDLWLLTDNIPAAVSVSIDNETYVVYIPSVKAEK
jgi:prepilin-type N-terminal cleavage/methylation domain-containing protein